MAGPLLPSFFRSKYQFNLPIDGYQYNDTVSYDLAKDYFTKLSAPVKGFYSFSESAHSPMFEESEKFEAIIEKDVLKGITNMSDPY